MGPEDTDDEAIGALIGLVVHDLRNPTSTIGANLAYLREVGPGDDEDAREALSDSEVAVGDLMRGLEQLAWIGRWFRGEPALQISEGDVAAALKTAADKHSSLNVELDAPPGLRARGGGSLALVVKVNLYLTDLSDFSKVNEIMALYFAQPYPARAAVGVSSLPRGALFEAEAVMVLD